MKTPIADRPPLEYDPVSERPCKACLHVVAHNYREYEDTHSRCMHLRSIRHGCAEHRRYSKRCDESAAGACWSEDRRCNCSEEDRLIADLRSWIYVLEGSIGKAALAGLLRGGKVRV